MSWSFAEVNKPLIQKVKKSLLALFSFEIVDFANTSANLHLCENHNKNKRSWGMFAVTLSRDKRHWHYFCSCVVFFFLFLINRKDRKIWISTSHQIFLKPNSNWWFSPNYIFLMINNNIISDLKLISIWKITWNHSFYNFKFIFCLK